MRPSTDISGGSISLDCLLRIENPVSAITLSGQSDCADATSQASQAADRMFARTPCLLVLQLVLLIAVVTCFMAWDAQP